MNVILYWNAVTLEVHRRDFERPREDIEVGGPTRVSRAFAIVHAAMYNAQEAVAPRPGGPRLYLPAGLPAPTTPPGLVLAAGAVAGAAVAVLKRLWPAQSAYIDQQLQAFCNEQLRAGAPPAALASGADFGETVGLALAELRRGDGHDRPDENVYLEAHCHHQPDPMVPSQPRLSTHWGRLRPFLIPVGGGGTVDPAAYLAPPPRCGTPRYRAAALDVQTLGRAHSLHPAAPGERTPQQTVTGIFWGYDGARGLGVPPRLYNQVVRAFAQAQPAITDAEAALLFARINMAMADAAIVAWGAKYRDDLWRPVIGLRADGDDPGWVPLGIPRTNSPGEFFRTPDFPAYPSGHATFGAAALRSAALFYADLQGRPVRDLLTADTFGFTSDEYDGTHTDPRGDRRPRLPQKLTLAQAIVDNAVSRVYLGVHWRFDGLGTVAPAGLEGAPLPTDPAAAPGVPQEPDEARIGGVPAGLTIADQVRTALP